MSKSIFKSSIFLVLFLQSFILSAQDTVVVQTFTWDSIGRSGHFDFPENETSWEKILMIYNMRCFDAAVGNGAVGCKEWDYSCNTFVHVPDQKDSTRAFKYDHEVSGISDDYFAYTDETHYTYYAFDLIDTEYDKVHSEYMSDVTGTDAEPLILDNREKAKVQLLYTAEELLTAGFSAGELNGIAFDVLGGTELLRFRVDVAAVSFETLSNNDVYSGEKLNVFYNHADFSNPGEKRINFHTPFEWDGSSNLLFEISYNLSHGDVNPLELSAHSSNSTAMTILTESGKEHALEFGGSLGLELDPQVFEPIENEITIAFSVFGRPQDLPKNTTILEGRNGAGQRTVNIHLPWSNSGIYWDCGNVGGTYDRIDKTAPAMNISAQWNHWVFTKNISTGSMKIYLNGNLWHSGTGKTRPIDIQSFRLGSNVGHSLGYYGLIDEFSVWNKELDENQVKQLVSNSIVPSHPLYQNLLIYFDMEEGDGNVLNDGSSNNSTTSFEGGPMWRKMQGRDLSKNYTLMQVRPDIRVFSGDYDIDQEITQEIDTVVTPQHSVIQYGVENNKLVILDTYFTWEAIDSRLYNELGEELDSYWVDPIDFLIFDELKYYTFKDAKLELLSLVTPYGNGLDLGPGGKTFTFDVSDFESVLKGNRRLTVEFGAKQEELDIKFLFIEGTPSRRAIDIRNIWPFARGYYDPIQDDRIFESRMVSAPSNAKMGKIRSSITGHGQNGEFQPRTHRISVGNQKEFDMYVWKECAFNPIYPQGGTWVYDRAGWCPGMATDLYELDVTSYMDAGGEMEVDYNVIGNSMDQANYLVSNQIVYYDDPNFTLDAALEHIVRPNQNAVEFARFNPLCSDPMVIIKNNGTQELTQMKIKYGVQGLGEKVYTWTGSLAYLETEEVSLPVDDLGFWGVENENQFYAEISDPNGLTDEYNNNNKLNSTYIMTDVFEGYERWLLRVRTNGRAFENEYSVVDQDGNVIVERKDLVNNTTYDDEISLPEGCYSFEIKDSGNDGLSFWANPTAGSGWVSIRRMENENVSFEKIKFESDFGGGFRYDFIIDGSTNTENLEGISRIGLYPNPVQDMLTIEAETNSIDPLNIMVYSIEGIQVLEEQWDTNGGTITKKIDTGGLHPGKYVIRVFNDKVNWVKTFVKIQ